MEDMSVLAWLDLNEIHRHKTVSTVSSLHNYHIRPSPYSTTNIWWNMYIRSLICLSGQLSVRQSELCPVVCHVCLARGSVHWTIISSFLCHSTSVRYCPDDNDLKWQFNSELFETVLIDAINFNSHPVLKRPTQFFKKCCAFSSILLLSDTYVHIIHQRERFIE